MSEGPERRLVEKPLIEQLIAMTDAEGRYLWKHTTGNPNDPSATGRESFRDTLLLDDLKDALRRLNLNDHGEPWLDQRRILQATNALQRLEGAQLLEKNEAATTLLVKGTEVDGPDGTTYGQRQQTIRYIDWDEPANNTFRVIDQFKVKCPPGQKLEHIYPDLVLFVNGIPLVVIECKRPPEGMESPEPLVEQGVDQLQRYANRRKAMGLVDTNEGCEALFQTNQFIVSTCGEQARVGTFSSSAVHFLEWKDPHPLSREALAEQRGTSVSALTSQEVLVAGMLQPETLLDLVRHFTLFMEAGNRRIKIVCRYQQFRGVHKAVHRLLTGKTRLQDGEYDRRGGLIWHTQGSGKSLSMVFLIRKMRSHPRLTGYKVVAVTDRLDLQKQLAATATLTNETLTVVTSQKRGLKTISSRDVLQEVLRREGKDLVFATIQKYRGDIIESEAGEEALPARSEPLPELNTSDEILVLVDEAHRSHTNTAHANLMRALPNCVKIGFTGTPIIMGAKKETSEIFGEFIDRYTIREAEADGATVPILYEMRTSGAAVRDGRELDDVFEDLLAERTDEEKRALQQKYATRSHIAEAESLIAAKARDMLRHYVENILPNGFKAQLVATSRLATLRYYAALQAARDELITEIKALDASVIDLDTEALASLDRKTGFLVRSRRFLPTIERLEFAPVISGGHNDTVDPTGEWSNRTRINERIKNFKKPLFHGGVNQFDEKESSQLAFLIVKSMLLTGFDAPIAQVMYLDRSIKEAELLQAVARVNRTHSKDGVKKTCGIVVDYYGVAHHLTEALAAYSADDVEGALQSLATELPRLRECHGELLELFHEGSSGRAPQLVSLSERDRAELVRRFADWKHRHIPDPERSAKLGDGSSEAAEAVLDAFETLMLYPTPTESGHDPYQKINLVTISSLKNLLSCLAGERDQMLLYLPALCGQVEAAVFKIIALFEPEAYLKLEGKGLLRAIWQGLHSNERSRFRPDFKYSDPKEVNWTEKLSYEYATSETITTRNKTQHGETGNVDVDAWDSIVAFLLGLVDENRSDLDGLSIAPLSEADKVEQCVQLLGESDQFRAKFQVKLKQFLSLIDTVLPRPEALPYIDDAKRMAHIQAKARNRYRDSQRLVGQEVGAKVRALIDQHVISLGIDPQVAPMELTSSHFEAHVAKERSPRAQASEMEHALRYHIRKHLNEDPVHYEELSKRLKDILKTFEGDWESQVKALQALVQEADSGRQADDSLGLDPDTEAPFYDVLKQATGLEGDAVPVDDLKALTLEIVGHIKAAVSLVGFWSEAKVSARKELRGQIFQAVDFSDLLADFDQIGPVTDTLMELAKAKNYQLTS